MLLLEFLDINLRPLVILRRDQCLYIVHEMYNLPCTRTAPLLQAPRHCNHCHQTQDMKIPSRLAISANSKAYLGRKWIYPQHPRQGKLEIRRCRTQNDVMNRDRHMATNHPTESRDVSVISIEYARKVPKELTVGH